MGESTLMANVKISGLPLATNALGTQELEVNDSGVSRKVTGSQMVALVEGAATAFVKDTDLLTVTQVEAEAGVGTTRRAWTAQRVKQAIDALAAAEADSSVNISTITPATTADVTLTLAQYTADVLVIETGAWTAARNIIVPNEARSWQVISNSAYAATVKTAAGSGVAVPAGQSRPLVCNGTNVVDPLDAYYEKSEIAVANSAPIKTALNASGSAPIYACRAWVNFDGKGTPFILGSANVSSITDNGTGHYRVNFTTAMENAEYCGIATAGRPAAEGLVSEAARAASSFTVKVISDNGAAVDAEFVNVAIIH